jgi:hypothetical protein
MGLRTLGRWLYHAVTSAHKRPHIEATLGQIETLAGRAAAKRDSIALLELLEELSYRVTSTKRRDGIKAGILVLLLEFEGIELRQASKASEIAEARSSLETAQRQAECYVKRDARAKQEAERKAKEAAAEQARQEAEAKAQREEAERKAAERKAKEAAAEQARQEAEAKAQREEAERKAAERKAKEAAAEQARQEAEAKAQREEAERKAAERKAKEAAAEKARREAEAKAQREEAERKAAERKAKEAAAEQARQEAEAKAQREEAERKAAERKAKEAAAEKARLDAGQNGRQDAEPRQGASGKNNPRNAQGPQPHTADGIQPVERSEEHDLAEQIRKFLEARPLTKPQTTQDEGDAASRPKGLLQTEEATQSADQARKAGELETDLLEVVAKVGQRDGAALSGSVDVTEGTADDEQAASDAKRDADIDGFTAIRSVSVSAKGMSREEQREERREIARLRRLDREENRTDQSENELVVAGLDIDCEQAEQFAPYLKAIPANWPDWSEQHWNIKLLHYCFVQKANENSSQGIPSTEEDLAFVTGDRDSAPADIAHALVERVREFSVNHGLSPARLLTKRLETWDHMSASPPRFFAFLWTTCLIAQGFPSPFEKGEFHKRYQQKDVYGANESQYLSRNLPAAWLQLSRWLDRDDIFDRQGHRRLVLPKIDPQRSIISHSWKLSFPCRSDRRKLHDALGKDRKGHTSRESIDLQLISNIFYQGDFTPEFTTALKQQIDLVQKGNEAEEWFSAIIRREIEAQGTSEVQSARKEKPKGMAGMDPKIMLHLDDEDCYLELVLPSQSVAIEKPRCLSNKTYCTVTLETKGKMQQVVGELDIDDTLEDLIIPDIRVKIDEEQDEYVLRLRHEGLDNAVLTEWSCEGLPNSTPYILFNSETNQIIADEILNCSSLSFLFRRNWDVALSDGIEGESEDPISVSRLGGWRLLLLAKTSPLEQLETISLANVTGEKLDICWVDSDDGKSKSRPLLKGLGLPGQATRFIMLAESPDVWLPPGITDVQIEMFKTEDDEFYMPIGSLQVPSTESWHKAGVRELITCPGLYSVRLSYSDNSNARTRRWSRHIVLAEEYDISSLDPAPLQARYRFKETSKVLYLEKDVSPFIFKEPQEFWNAVWLILDLWPHEKIRVNLACNGENYSQVLSATSSGSCEIPISAFEPYLLTRELARLSIQRQGFICEYEMAVLNEITAQIDQHLPRAQVASTTTPTKRTNQRRRPVNTLEVVVYGMRSEKTQDMLVAEIEDLLEDGFGYLDRRTMEYPDSKRAPGRRFVFHRISFDSLNNEEKNTLHSKIDSLIMSSVERSGLDFRAEWSRRRE